MTKLRSQEYSLVLICDFVGVSRQAYHKQLQKQSFETKLYLQVEKLVFKNRKVRSRVGLRTIYYKEKLSSLLGLNQFEQQMSDFGHALKPYRSYLKTTDSRGFYYKFDNLISGIEVCRANQVIVGDITYYQSPSGLYYIFHFQDYYTLEIKGLIGSKTMEGINAERCLRQVFDYNKQSSYNHQLIVHTDRGSQYRSHKFQSMLRRAKIRPSHAMNCFENGLSERANGIIKNEYLNDYDIRSISHLNRVLKEIKHQMNEVWPSKSLGYKTPKEYARWVLEQNSKHRPKKLVKEVH